MSDSPPELDLKFLPDWLKEGASVNRYANYEGEREDRPRRDDRGGDRGRDPRGGPGAQRRGPGGPGGPRNDRGPRPGGPPPRRDQPPGARRDDRGGARPQGDRRPGSRPGEQRRDFNAAPRPPAAPLPPQIRVEFLPEPNCVLMIGRQIKSGTRAYPLFGTARLFLEKPERHRVRFTSLDAARPLFQIGDGPVSFDRSVVERNAFRHMKEEYYVEETVQGEPLKGNFSNVARCRSTGTWLAPTNHHAYQPSLRRVYEERFSRRMSFQEFLREEVEILTAEQAIADWKEQARSVTTFTTTKEAEPLVFKSEAEAEVHFRQHYLPQLVKSGISLEASGDASRAVANAERHFGEILRDMWERERGFPASLVNALRPKLVDAGLHFFKHRKRIIFITPIRPQRHATGQLFSEQISAILGAVEAQPKITRPQLAVRLLGEQQDTPEAAAKKASLAGDLHYLVYTGHVIEFHDGTLDLPLSPRAEAAEEAGQQQPPREKPARPPQQRREPAAQVAVTGAEQVAVAAGENPEPLAVQITSSEELPPHTPLEIIEAASGDETSTRGDFTGSSLEASEQPTIVSAPGSVAPSEPVEIIQSEGREADTAPIEDLAASAAETAPAEAPVMILAEGAEPDPQLAPAETSEPLTAP